MADNVLTRVEVRGEDVRSWLRHVIPGYIVFTGGVLWVTAAARASSLPWLVLAGVFLALSTIGLDATLKRQRQLKGDVARVLRIAVAVVQLVSGLVLLLWVDGDAWKFLGVTALAFVLATVVAELRYSIRWMHVRGPVTLGAALLLVVAGLFPVAAISLRAGLLLAGVGVVAAVIGGELHSEDWLRAVRRRSPTAMRSIGAVLVAVAGLILVAAGSEPRYVLILLLVVLPIFVARVASDSDSGELIVVLMVALVWAAAPRDVAAGESIDPQPGESFFVAMGDSYISGEGAERFFEGTNDKEANECRRAPTAYPVRLAEHGADPIPDRVLFLACSGALGVDLYGDRPGRTEPVSQLDQYRDAMTRLDESDVAFVLLSVGGNDAGFGEVGQTCVGPGDCSEIGQRWIDDLASVEQKLDIAYDEVAAEVGDIPVYVVPYPVPLTEHGCWWSWLTDDEHRFITGFVTELNAVVESAATRHGFTFLGAMQAAFEPDALRICDGGPSGLGMNFFAMNPTSGSLGDVVDPRNWIHNSFHPNARGHEAMFEVAQAWLTSPPAPPVPADEPPHDVGDMDEVTPGGPVEQCGGDALAYCSEPTSAWQGLKVSSLLRLAVGPLVLALIGCWMFLMPWVRWASEHRVNLARPLLAALTKLEAWLHRLVGWEH